MGVVVPARQPAASAEPQRQGVSCNVAAHFEEKIVPRVSKQTCASVGVLGKMALHVVPSGSAPASRLAVPGVPSQVPPSCAGSRQPLVVAHARQSGAWAVRHACVDPLGPHAGGGVPVSTPVSGAPVSATPVSGAPASATPVSGAPVSATPVSGAPASATPVSGALASVAPVSSLASSPVPASAVPASAPETASQITVVDPMSPQSLSVTLTVMVAVPAAVQVKVVVAAVGLAIVPDVAVHEYEMGAGPMSSSLADATRFTVVPTGTSMGVALRLSSVGQMLRTPVTDTLPVFFGATLHCRGTVPEVVAPDITSN